jgi:hypothetical protein
VVRWLLSSAIGYPQLTHPQEVTQFDLRGSRPFRRLPGSLSTVRIDTQETIHRARLAQSSEEQDRTDEEYDHCGECLGKWANCEADHASVPGDSHEDQDGPDDEPYEAV